MTQVMTQHWNKENRIKNTNHIIPCLFKPPLTSALISLSKWLKSISCSSVLRKWFNITNTSMNIHFSEYKSKSEETSVIK